MPRMVQPQQKHAMQSMMGIPHMMKQEIAMTRMIQVASAAPMASIAEQYSCVWQCPHKSEQCGHSLQATEKSEVPSMVTLLSAASQRVTVSPESVLFPQATAEQVPSQSRVPEQTDACAGVAQHQLNALSQLSSTLFA